MNPLEKPTWQPDANKFELVEQVGGIRTGTLDYPNPAGSQSCRVAHVNTGAGLRYTVSIDRGGDIVEANHNATNLAFLTPNGYKPPNPAYHHELDWLSGWPGGLVTTCGPIHIGGPRQEDSIAVSLHGRYSNTPEAVQQIINPDVRHGRSEMRLELLIRDTRMFGPNIEIHRQIESTLGMAEIRVADRVTNVGDERCPHSLLYHVNLGYPLLDARARIVMQGLPSIVRIAEESQSNPDDEALNRFKTIPEPSDTYVGVAENCFLNNPVADEDGTAHVGLINPQRSIAVELAFPVKLLPRLANWQHYGPRGCYAIGIEPYCGTLVGKATDTHPLAEQWLEPEETRNHELTIRVHDHPAAIESFAAHDGPLIRGDA